MLILGKGYAMGLDGRKKCQSSHATACLFYKLKCRNKT